MNRLTQPRLTKREFRRRYADLVENLSTQIRAEVDDFSLDDAAVAQRKTRASNDLEYFARQYFPHYCVRPPSSVHRWLFAQLPALLAAETGGRLAAAAPRGEGKSTTVSLIFVLWAILTRRKKFALILSNTLEQAVFLLAAIRAEIETNPRLRADFGDVDASFRDQETTLTLPEGHRVRIVARGSGQSFRGLRRGADRPDLLIGDDLETDVHVGTAEQRRKMRHWFGRTALRLGGVNAPLDVVVVGTILHWESLLRGLIESPLWTARKFSAIEQWPEDRAGWDKFEQIALEQGEQAARHYYQRRKKQMDAGAVLSWPEGRDLSSLMLDRAGDHDGFELEFQNNPVSLEENPYAESIQFWSELPENLVNFGACDPSMGTRGGDPSAILVGGLDPATGVLYVQHADIKIRAVDEILRAVIEQQGIFRCVAWYFEEVGFAAYLAAKLVEQGRLAGTPVPALPYVPRLAKNLRIEGLRPHVARGSVLLGRDQRTLIDQLRYWPRAAHDDGPDALAMLCDLALAHRAGPPRIATHTRHDLRQPAGWRAPY